MSCMFADSFYFFAVVNPKDKAHRRVLEFATRHEEPTVTTARVLTEFADGLAVTAHRPAFSRITGPSFVRHDQGEYERREELP